MRSRCMAPCHATGRRPEAMRRTGPGGLRSHSRDTVRAWNTGNSRQRPEQDRVIGISWSFLPPERLVVAIRRTFAGLAGMADGTHPLPDGRRRIARRTSATAVATRMTMPLTESSNLSRRQREILDIARARGTILVEPLAQRFGVTSQTVRRDLNQLSRLRLPPADPRRRRPDGRRLQHGLRRPAAARSRRQGGDRAPRGGADPERRLADREHRHHHGAGRAQPLRTRRIDRHHQQPERRQPAAPVRGHRGDVGRRDPAPGRRWNRRRRHRRLHRAVQGGPRRHRRVRHRGRRRPSRLRPPRSTSREGDHRERAFGDPRRRRHEVPAQRPGAHRQRLAARLLRDRYRSAGAVPRAVRPARRAGRGSRRRTAPQRPPAEPAPRRRNRKSARR